MDSKAPIESYLDALQATDHAQRDAALTEHLKKVRSHIDLLSKKDYAGKLSALGQVVDGVVLFIPVEGALSMALERDPQLLEYAFSKNIILTFPTSLLAILKGLAMTIQQAEIAKNIDEIQAQAVELHKRFSIFIDKFNDIGSQLNRLNKSFNATVGSAQSRLLPQGRRFAELAGQNGEIDLSDQIDEVVGRFNRTNSNSSIVLLFKTCVFSAECAKSCFPCEFVAMALKGCDASSDDVFSVTNNVDFSRCPRFCSRPFSIPAIHK